MVTSLSGWKVGNKYTYSVVIAVVCINAVFLCYRDGIDLRYSKGIRFPPPPREVQSHLQVETRPNISPSDGVSGQGKTPSTPLANFNMSTKIKMSEECYRNNLGPTQADDLAKIESYKFDGIEKYTKDLFPNNADWSQEQENMQMIPTFVSGISSNHLRQVLIMIETFNETVRAKYKDVKIIIFDLGLKREEIRKVESECQCEVRKFHFKKYPKHVRTLPNFAWKAIVIQIVANEYPFIIWMDASVRFITNDLDALFKQVQEYGLVVWYDGRNGGLTITEATHLKTFQFLNEQPCTYGLESEVHATVMMLYASPFIKKYFLYPFVACALSFGCMEPEVNGSNKYRSCRNRPFPRKYHYCHRADQSIVGILFHRLFHSEPNKHKLDYKYIDICRKAKRKC